MSRKPLAIFAAGVALATPSPALAMHGPKEQPARVSRNAESPKFVQAPLVITVPASRSFNWLDAGIGASVMAGCVLVLAGGRRVRLGHVS